MKTMPRDTNLDSTLSLLSDGYDYIGKRCRKYGTDVFQTRILLQNTICMRGEAAAEIFYDPSRFTRKNAAPGLLQKTLFGEGGVQGLDGEAHRSRKELFMSLMTKEGVRQLGQLVAKYWNHYLDRWEQKEQIVLFDEVREILCRAVCEWAGVPLPEKEVPERTRQLVSLIEGAGPAFFRQVKGRLARKQAEQWMGELIVRERQKGEAEEPATALAKFSHYRTPEGHLLSVHDTAVDLLNVLRPTVAIGRYIVFTALALHEFPAFREKLQSGQDEDFHRFVQEVRRFYPFFPFAAARVREGFSWNGYEFPQGWRVLLDLYGTNHDPALWEQPQRFDPERFRDWDGSPFNFIPQGGGDFYQNHRCAGEWITIEVTKTALRLLVQSMQYNVPEQDLHVSVSRLPAEPKSGFIMKNVKRKP